MTLTAVGVVLLRQETARRSYRVMRLHRERTELDQKLWARQMELARLREPGHVRDKVHELDLSIVPPRAGAPAANSREGGAHGFIRTGD